MKTIAFFGSDAFSTATLHCLLEHQLELGIVVATVFTQPPSPQGRGLSMQPSPVELLARERGIRVVTCTNRRDLDTFFTETPTHKFDAGVLASFGIIISQFVIDQFPLGIINIHPSLLPRWRGASPIQSAILHGDPTTGVSLMKLVREMDAGPIYAQSTVPILPQMTHQELQPMLADLGCGLLRSHLSAILANTLLPRPQEESGVTTCSKISKSDGALDPLHQSAREIDRRVRALWPWPKTWMIWESPSGEEISLRIESGYPVSTMVVSPGSIQTLENGDIAIGTLSGTYIISMLGRPGRPTRDAVSFARGFPLVQGKITSPSYDKT